MILANLGRDDKVVTVKDGELRKGVIINAYDLNPPIFAVKFEDGTVEKVHFDKVSPDPETVIQEDKNEPVEKSEITITPDKFREITCHVIAEETKEHKLIGLAFALIMGRIHKALFIEPWEND